MEFAKWYLEIMKVVRVLVGLRLLGTDTQDQEEAYCLLPIAYCLLPIACCLLPIAYCLLPIA